MKNLIEALQTRKYPMLLHTKIEKDERISDNYGKKKIKEALSL